MEGGTNARCVRRLCEFYLPLHVPPPPVLVPVAAVKLLPPSHPVVNLDIERHNNLGLLESVLLRAKGESLISNDPAQSK